MPHYLKIIRALTSDEKTILRESVFVVMPAFFWHLALTAMDDMAVLIFFNSDQLASAAGLLSAGLAVINIFGRTLLRKALALVSAGIGVLILWYLHDLVSYDLSQEADQFFIDTCYLYVILTFLGFFLKLQLQDLQIYTDIADQTHPKSACRASCYKGLLNCIDLIRYAVVMIFMNLPAYALYFIKEFTFEHDVTYYNGTVLLVDHDLNETIDGVMIERPTLAYPFWLGLGFVNTIAAGMFLHRVKTTCCPSCAEIFPCCAGCLPYCPCSAIWRYCCGCWEQDEEDDPIATVTDLPTAEVKLEDGVLIIAIRVASLTQPQDQRPSAGALLHQQGSNASFRPSADAQIAAAVDTLRKGSTSLSQTPLRGSQGSVELTTSL